MVDGLEEKPACGGGFLCSSVLACEKDVFCRCDAQPERRSASRKGVLALQEKEIKNMRS